MKKGKTTPKTTKATKSKETTVAGPKSAGRPRKAKNATETKVKALESKVVASKAEKNEVEPAKKRGRKAKVEKVVEKPKMNSSKAKSEPKTSSSKASEPKTTSANKSSSKPEKTASKSSEKKSSKSTPTVSKLIGLMDPNSYSFRVSLEKLIAFLDPHIKYKGKVHHVTTRRISTRPYDVLQAECPYHAIVNRGAHWNPHHNSFFMTIGHDSYLLNDMISFKAINKNTSYGHMYKLGLKIPATLAVPQQNYDELKKDEKAIPELIFSEHEFFDLQDIGDEVGYPAYLKPQSGGGWVGVVKVNNAEELTDAYRVSGDKPMNLQKAIDYREFVRTVGIGPQMSPMHYNPKAKLSHDRYLRSPEQAIEFNFISPEERAEICKISKVINAFYGWDHNSCETLIGHDHQLYPIDFANAYPDSALTSLQFHFPDIVKAMARWMIFCAVSEKKKSFNFARDWQKYFAIAKKDNLSYEEKLDQYVAIADEYFETEKFEKFCQECLPDFEEKALEFFSSDDFNEIIETEVGYYFNIPKEIPEQIAHYQGIHNFWIQCEKHRLGKA